MSSSGIGKIGGNPPLTPKDRFSLNNNSKKTAESGPIKDSLKISSDGVKLEEMFQNLRFIKSEIEEKPELAEKIHEIPDEKMAAYLQKNSDEIETNLQKTLETIKINSKVAVNIHSLDASSVLALLES